MVGNNMLYTVIHDVEVPTHAKYDPMDRAYKPVSETRPAVISMCWPNGYPCLAVEIYLLEIGQSLTVRQADGGSLKVLAAELTHLIRFCWRRRKNFWDLNTDDFYEFAQDLQMEKHPRSTLRRRRNNNTTNRILQSSILFLQWLQQSLSVNRVIVGTIAEHAQIRLREITSLGTDGVHRRQLVYPYKPTSDTPDPKRPMPHRIRNQLWSAVAGLDKLNAGSNVVRNHQTPVQKYLRARRELLLSVLEATGCRPGELVRLSVSQNADCAASKQIILPTLKRRKVSDPLRRIPLERGIAMKIEVFIQKHRQNLLAHLSSLGRSIAPNDAVFVCSRKGTPISAASLTREFQRIVTTAGIEERACMSMFRHRFITNMVKLHLHRFIHSSEGKSRSLMTESDYRTILRRVATFTGHGSERSLLHYIDWAWEELGVFDYAASAHELMVAIDDTIQKLSSLVDAVRLQKHVAKEQIVETVVEELETIRGRVQSALIPSARAL